MYKVSITKEAVNNMSTVSFPGQIYIVDKLSMVTEAIRVLRKYDVVGFDTETRPSFKKGIRHKVSLLQLSTPNECFLFRLNKIGIPLAIKRYLEDENKLKVGLSIHDDFRSLSRLSDIEPKGFIDMQHLAQQFKINDISLQKIYAILFGERISKSQQLSNWESAELSEAQQRYASIDAWACINIYKHLSSGRFVPEESQYYTLIEEDEKAK